MFFLRSPRSKTFFWLVATQIFFSCSPRILGEMIQFDGSHIFQMGWFNHQLDYVGSFLKLQEV